MICKISLSSSDNCLLPSKMAIIKSASLALFLERSIPICSTLLSAFLIPAVSMILIGIPLMETDS